MTMTWKWVKTMRASTTFEQPPQPASTVLLVTISGERSDGKVFYANSTTDGDTRELWAAAVRRARQRLDGFLEG